MRKHFHAVALTALIAAAPVSVFAQTSYGTIEGAVKDATGAVVPGAVVTVKSRLTGETQTAKTKDNGSFHLESLGTGAYDVTITASGFDTTVVQNLQVDPSVVTSVNPVLKVGQVQDTVEVSGVNEVLQTETGEVSNTIDAKSIVDLPLSSLNAYALATTLPGVTTITTYRPTNGVGFSANGTRPRQNNFLIEGQDNNDAGIAGQGLQPENEEALQSVTFLLSSNSAEFGRGGGAISNLVYRSGTNQFHGAIWDRLLNSSLNATDHGTTYNGGIKAKFRENIYGFRIGGPIKREKLFFFVSQQFDHYDATASPSVLTVPTAAGYATLKRLTQTPTLTRLLQAYAGLVGADPSTGNKTFPTYFKQVALGPDPVTGVDRGVATFGGVQRAVGTITRANELIAKGDYLYSQNDKLQLRFVRSPFTEPYDFGNFPSQLPLFDTDQNGNSYNAGIVEDHNFSPNLTNELRLSYGRIGFLFDLRPDTYSNPLLGPTVTISGIQGYGIPTNAPQGRFHDTYQLQDALTYAHGTHTGKVGFDVAQVRVRDAVPFVFYGSQGYIADTAAYDPNSYSALANYIDDYSGNGGVNTASLTKYFGNNLARPTLTNQGYYVQDHWKVSSDLAIDAGFRYEYYGAPFNYIPYPAVDPTNLACYPCHVGVIPNFMNLAPRLGFAYSPGTDKKTVFRGGFGIFYDNTFTNVADNIQASAPNAATPTLYNGTTGRGTANWSNAYTGLNTNPLATNSVTSVTTHFRNPRTYQYNAAIERALPGAVSLTVGYVGSRGQHLYGLDYLNPTVPGSTTRIVPTRGAIAVHDNSGDSNYNSAQLELQHRYRTGLLTRISYTYSKFLDDVSEEYSSGNYSAYPQIQLPFNNHRGLDYGPSAYDHRQRAVGSIVYTIPKWNASGFEKIGEAVLSGIQVATIAGYQSGAYGNLETGYDVNGDGVNNDRPVLENKSAPLGSFAVRAADFYPTAAKNPTGAPYCDGTYVYNGYSKNPTTGANDQFCHPVALSAVHFYMGDHYAQGNTISRNSIATPGIIQNDFTAEKNFPLYKDRASMLFRAECFNCVNHGNTGVPNLVLYGNTDLPQAAGYNYGTESYNNLAASVTGGRTLRFFIRAEF